MGSARRNSSSIRSVAPLLADVENASAGSSASTVTSASRPRTRSVIVSGAGGSCPAAIVRSTVSNPLISTLSTQVPGATPSKLKLPS